MPTRYPLSRYICLSRTVGLGASLSGPYTSKRLNVQTLIATLEIGISLFADLTKGCSTHITGSPYFSISDTQQMLARHHHEN